MIELQIPAIERVERYRSIIPDWDAFLAALGRPLPLCMWTNTLRTDARTVAEHLETEGIESQPIGWHAGAFKGRPSDIAGQSLPFVGGLYHIQEEVSLLPVVLLDPQPGERILDMCAAPGNKTAQIAVAMENTGTIVANDRSALRMRATRGTLDRLGVINTAITTTDAEKFPESSPPFDRVLLDAPCTCEGTSRKNVSAFIASGKDRSASLQKKQIAMLRRAVELCRPGGRIAYSTCTYAPEENELVVDAALKQFGGAVRLLPARLDGVASSPGISAWNGRALEPSLTNAMRVWPHQNDTGGFFVAVLEKSGGNGRHAPARARSGGGKSSEGRAKWIDLLHSRFGIPSEIFAEWSFDQPNRKYVFVTPNDHDPPVEPEPVSDGMPLIRTSLRFPKLTTAGARIVGGRAKRNVVEVSTQQAESYVSREDFYVSEWQAGAIEGTGYVIVQHRRIVLGVGIYFEEGRRVVSMFPKVLAQAVTLPIPGGSGR